MEMIRIFEKGENFAVYRILNSNNIKIYDCGNYYTMQKNYDSTIEDIEDHNLVKFDLIEEERLLINYMIDEILDINKEY